MAPSDLERRRRAIADALRAVMAAPVERGQALELGDGVDERASVPPLEPAETMSEHASRALFGHR